MTTIIAIDPGLATGACVFTIDAGSEPVLVEAVELGVDDVAPWLRAWLVTDPDAVVACEAFIITAETHKKSQQTWSLEHIGVIRQTMRDIGRTAGEVRMQTPADAKNLFPNPALKKLGYWHRGGEGHALDAIRHGLLRMVKSNLWQPTRLLT